MIRFDWDRRKAKRNERIHGVSFTLAEYLLGTGLGIPVEEQFTEEEWRTVVLVPLPTGVLISITVATDEGEEDGENSGSSDQHWLSKDIVVRIINARKATAAEETLYVENRPPDGTPFPA